MLGSVISRLGEQPGPLCCAYLAARDATRLRGAESRETELVKQRRKSKRTVEKSAEEAHIEEEGITYGAGEF